MKKNELKDAFELFAAVKVESDLVFKETAMLLEANDKKIKKYECESAYIRAGYEVPKDNSKTSIIRRIVSLRADLNRLAQMLKEA